MTINAYESIRGRPRRVSQCHLRKMDSGVCRAFRAYCRRHMMLHRQAVEVLMRRSAVKRARLTIDRTLYNDRGSLNVRGVHPDVLRHFKAYCVLMGYGMRDAIEHILHEAAKADKKLKLRAQQEKWPI
jgi:hypothetical protein